MAFGLDDLAAISASLGEATETGGGISTVGGTGTLTAADVGAAAGTGGGVGTVGGTEVLTAADLSDVYALPKAGTYWDTLVKFVTGGPMAVTGSNAGKRGQMGELGGPMIGKKGMGKLEGPPPPLKQPAHPLNSFMQGLQGKGMSLTGEGNPWDKVGNFLGQYTEQRSKFGRAVGTVTSWNDARQSPWEGDYKPSMTDLMLRLAMRGSGESWGDKKD